MKVMPLSYTPVIIIGAGRSGTNILRDVLSSLPGFSTWGCDEINPIWHHGNLSWPNDEIPACQARRAVISFIRDRFTKLWKDTGQPKFIVEKTCANSLRVDYVDTVFPEAKYIYIVRDGYDVIKSANKRWKGDLELYTLPYYWAKIRNTPLIDLPKYGTTFIRNKLVLIFGGKKHLSTWGPQFDGVDKYQHAALEEICARQWSSCIAKSDKAFANIAPERVFTLKYEDFTSDPKSHIRDVLDFLTADVAQADINTATKSVHNYSVGKGRKALEMLPEKIVALMQKSLQAHGYRI